MEENIPIAPQPVMPENTAPVKKSFNPLLLFGILVVILILLVGVVFSLKSNTPKSVIAPIPQVSPKAVVPTPTPISGVNLATGQSDSQLDQDSQTVDQNLNNLDQELKNVDAGLNDQPVDLTP